MTRLAASPTAGDDAVPGHRASGQPRVPVRSRASEGAGAAGGLRRSGTRPAGTRSTGVLLAGALLAWALGMLLALGTASPALAVDAPPRPQDGAVLDETATLTPEQVDRLNDLIAEKNRQNGEVRAAVLVVYGTQGESIEDYSRDVATQWGVGDAGEDNGVLVVAAMADRTLRIEVADGAQDVLPSGQAEHIMKDELEPGFRDGDYETALRDTLTAVYDQATPQAASDRASSKLGFMVIGAVLLLLVALVLTVAIRRWWRRGTRLREAADREAEEFRRAHPHVTLTPGMVADYRRYRMSTPGPPRRRKPVRFTGRDGAEHTLQYAPTLAAWLPLYAENPGAYRGAPPTSGSSSPTYGSSAGSSGSSGSFGGGGGFSGGGSSGSF